MLPGVAAASPSLGSLGSAQVINEAARACACVVRCGQWLGPRSSRGQAYRQAQLALRQLPKRASRPFQCGYNEQSAQASRQAALFACESGVKGRACTRAWCGPKEINSAQNPIARLPSGQLCRRRLVNLHSRRRPHPFQPPKVVVRLRLWGCI